MAKMRGDTDSFNMSGARQRKKSYEAEEPRSQGSTSFWMEADTSKHGGVRANDRKNSMEMDVQANTHFEMTPTGKPNNLKKEVTMTVEDADEEETRSTKEHIHADISAQHLNYLANTTMSNLFDLGSSSLLVEQNFRPRGLLT